MEKEISKCLRLSASTVGAYVSQSALKVEFVAGVSVTLAPGEPFPAKEMTAAIEDIRQRYEAIGKTGLFSIAERLNKLADSAVDLKLLDA